MVDTEYVAADIITTRGTLFTLLQDTRISPAGRTEECTLQACMVLLTLSRFPAGNGTLGCSALGHELVGCAA